MSGQRPKRCEHEYPKRSGSQVMQQLTMTSHEIVAEAASIGLTKVSNIPRIVR